MATAVQNNRRRFKISDDILLLEEVKIRNPYGAINKGRVWGEVAAVLNSIKVSSADMCPWSRNNLLAESTFLQLFKAALDDRAVRGRTTSLLKIFRLQHIKNRVKSGTEEQYGLLEALLTDIDSVVKDTEVAQEARKRAQVEKEEELEKASKIVKDAGKNGRFVARDSSEESVSVPHAGNLSIFERMPTDCLS